VKLLVATRSAHKLREIGEILAPVERVEILGLDDAGIAPSPAEADLEPHENFLENAASKARYFRELSGLPTVADDSGLEVEALEGAPGVRSKRFAPDRGLDGLARDRANNRYLVECLSGVPPDRRRARYVCEAVLLDDAGEWSFRGEAPGFILETEQGEGGFGYDPLFYDPDVGTTFACLDRVGKNQRSHRGKAFRARAAHLRRSSPANAG
jgi:XTP/dITP diphosphohydrolase